MDCGRFTAVGLAAALALLTAGCGGTTNTSGSNGLASGASVAPAGVAAYVTIETDQSSSQWDAASALLDKFPGRAKLLAAVRRSLKESSGLDWEGDIRPALGKEADVVVLDSKSGDDVVVLLQPADDAKFAALVRKGNAQDPSSKVVYEKVGDWTVASDSQAKIDEYKRQAAGPKLADDSAFTDAMATLSADALVKAYANGAKFTAALEKSFPSGAKAVDRNGKFVSGVAELVAEKDGVRLAGSYTTDGLRQQPKPYRAALLDQVPAGALLYLSFNGEAFGKQAGFEKQFRQGFLGGGAAAVPGLTQLLPLFEELGPVFAHENALYVRSGALIPEVTIVARPDSPEQGVAALDKLVAGLARRAGVRVTAKPITIGTVTAKEVDLGQISIYYGADGDNLIVSDQQQAFQDLKGSGPKLSGDATFKEARAAASMPDETNGFVYLNLEDSIPLVESLARLAGSPFSPDVVDNLGPLRTFVAWGKVSGSATTFAAFLEVR